MSKKRTFIISLPDSEDETKLIYYDDYKKFKTTKKIGDEVVFEGDVSAMDIRNEKTTLDISDISDWMDAVNTYIETLNEKNANGNSDSKIEYVIFDMDDRYACTYEKKVNGKTVESGKGWHKDLQTQQEKDAWVDGVIKYKKLKGITMPTEKINKEIEKIKAILDNLDSENPGEFEIDIPVLALKMPQLSENPCEMISNVCESVNTAITTISGLPSPKETWTRTKKSVKKNLQIAEDKVLNSIGTIAKSYCKPYIEKIEETKDYFEDIDAVIEENKKLYAEEYELYQKTMNEVMESEERNIAEDKTEILLNPPELKGFYPSSYATYTAMTPSSSRSSSSSYVPYSPYSSSYTSMDTGGIITYKDISFAPYGSIKLSAGNFAGGHNIYSKIASGDALLHLKESAVNCFIPILRAWDEWDKQHHPNEKSVWTISSGYRDPDYNARIGGAASSAHKYGYAIDILVNVGGVRNEPRVKELANFFASMCQSQHIGIDQILREYNPNAGTNKWGHASTWCHVGYRNAAREQRRQFFPDYNSKGGAGKHGACIILPN